MIYNLYLMYKTYNILLHLYGVYVALSFVYWSFGYSYMICSYFSGMFFVKQPQNQICDSK